MGVNEVTLVYWNQRKSRAVNFQAQHSIRAMYIQLSAITPDTLSILTNREILAINQDPIYGESISPFRWGVNVRGMRSPVLMRALTLDVVRLVLQRDPSSRVLVWAQPKWNR